VGAFPTRITSDEYAMADTLVIDEGGIDLMLDGDSVMAASFEGLDPFQIMWEILPEDYAPPTGVSQEAWDSGIEESFEAKEESSPEEIAEAVDFLSRALVGSLLNLAILKGWKTK